MNPYGLFVMLFALLIMITQTAFMVGSLSARVARSITIFISTAILLCGMLLLSRA